MRQILETEEHVAVPPMMYDDPFYRITYLIKEEIRKHKWIEGEKGRMLSWPEARAEWTEAHREEYERFVLDTLSFPDLGFAQHSPDTEEKPEQAEESSEIPDVARASAMLSKLPQRSGG